MSKWLNIGPYFMNHPVKTFFKCQSTKVWGKRWAVLCRFISLSVLPNFFANFSAFARSADLSYKVCRKEVSYVFMRSLLNRLTKSQLYNRPILLLYNPLEIQAFKKKDVGKIWHHGSRTSLRKKCFGRKLSLPPQKNLYFTKVRAFHKQNWWW